MSFKIKKGISITFDYDKRYKVCILCKISGGSVSSTAPIRYVVALPMHQNAEIGMHVFKNTKLMKQKHLHELFVPEEATMGPQARANAPRERNMPVIAPF